jgi:hypothetical protein
MTFLPSLLLTTTFLFQISNVRIRLIDSVRTHDVFLFLSFLGGSVFLFFFRYYFSDERLLFLLTLFFILDASSLFFVVLNFILSLHPYDDEDACKIRKFPNYYFPLTCMFEKVHSVIKM